MFQIHLTEARFYGITFAANLDAQHKNVLVVSYENRPNVTPGQPVEIIVARQRKYVGRVIAVAPPAALPPDPTDPVSLSVKAMAQLAAKLEGQSFEKHDAEHKETFAASWRVAIDADPNQAPTILT